MPHSIDFHSAEVAPNKYYKDIAARQELNFRFTAKHPGVFMYHCATQPVLTHIANGMVGHDGRQAGEPGAGRQASCG